MAIQMFSWRRNPFSQHLQFVCAARICWTRLVNNPPSPPQLQLITFILISWRWDILIETRHLNKNISIDFNRNNHRPKCLADWESKPVIAYSIIINMMASFPSLGCFVSLGMSGFIFLWIQYMLTSYLPITLIGVSLLYLLAFLTLCWGVCSFFAFHRFWLSSYKILSYFRL